MKTLNSITQQYNFYNGKNRKQIVVVFYMNPPFTILIHWLGKNAIFEGFSLLLTSSLISWFEKKRLALPSRYPFPD